jgi:basic membrane lipoprotein Med (substrate-binding protein (PBP1-ABC) superfamily)
MTARHALLTLGVASALAAGCGSEEPPPEPVAERVTLVSPGSSNEVDWTVGGREAFEAMLADERLEGAIVDGSTSDNLPAVFAQASHRADLVIAQEGSYAAAAAEAADRTEVPVLVWGDESLQERGRVGVVEIDGVTAGYAAGIAATRAAYTRRVAVVVCADGSPDTMRTWYEIASGFVAGARHAKAVRVTYARSPAGGRRSEKAAERTARRLIGAGAQMVIGLCGPGGPGVLRAVRDAGGEHQLIALNGIKARLRGETRVLVALEWSLAKLYRQAIDDVRDGTFARQPYLLSLGDGGITFHRTGRMPTDAYEIALREARRLERRGVAIPVAETDAELRALVAEGT